MSAFDYTQLSVNIKLMTQLAKDNGLTSLTVNGITISLDARANGQGLKDSANSALSQSPGTEVNNQAVNQVTEVVNSGEPILNSSMPRDSDMLFWSTNEELPSVLLTQEMTDGQ